MPLPVIALLRRAATTTLAATLLITGSATAEDGTSGTVPEPAESCVLVESSWVPSSPVATATTTAATPVSATPAAATPVSDSATPVAEVDPLQADLQAGVETILRCMSKNDAENLLKITNSDFRISWIGADAELSDEDFASLLGLMPRLPYELVSVSVVNQSEKSVEAHVTYLVGRQVHSEKWTLHQATIDGEKYWAVDSATKAEHEVPTNAGLLKLEISDSGFKLSPATVASGDVVLEISNTGKTPHEALILRVPDGMTAGDIAAAPTGIPEGATFIGQVTIQPGENGTIVLNGLRPGVYTVVDLLPDETGLPNISKGMITTFEVKRP